MSLARADLRKRVAVASAASLLLLCASCSTPPESHPISSYVQPSEVQGLTYFKDEHTGLCFAVMRNTDIYRWQIGGIAAVPCSVLAGLANTSTKTESIDGGSKEKP